MDGDALTWAAGLAGVAAAAFVVPQGTFNRAVLALLAVLGLAMLVRGLRS